MQFIYTQEEQQQLDQSIAILRILNNAAIKVQENFANTECTENCKGCVFEGTVIGDNTCLMKRQIDKSIKPDSNEEQI